MPGPRKREGCFGFAGFRYLRVAGLVVGPGGNRDSFYYHAAPEEDATKKVAGSNFLPFGSKDLTYMLIYRHGWSRTLAGLPWNSRRLIRAAFSHRGTTRCPWKD